MERHRAAGFQLEDGNPPIQLTLRCRVPGIAMWVECVRNPGRKVVVARRGSKAGNIKKCPLEITPQLSEDPGNQPLGLPVMDEPWLEFRKDSRVLLDRHLVLRLLGVVGCESLSDQPSGKFDQPKRT